MKGFITPSVPFAERRIIEMIKTRRELNEYLKYEISKYGQNVGLIYYLLGSEKAVIWNYQKRLRITEYYYNTHKKIRCTFSKILLHKKQNKYGLKIDLNVFGKGLVIKHLGSILTNSRVRVGENCTVHINTSFVAQGTNAGVPKLGNNIVVGVGATILGDIQIADGIAIGANSVVNKSFTEPNIAIAGCPAKKISNNGNSTWHKKISDSI